MMHRDDMLSGMGRFRTIIRRTIRGAASIMKASENAPVPAQFHAAMTIEEAWHNHPQAPSVFHEYHLPACDGCAVRFEETLEEAASAYGLDLSAFLTALNTLNP